MKDTAAGGIRATQGTFSSFLTFVLKHRLWVHVRTASACTHDLCLSKNKLIINFFHLKIIVFTPVKNCCILHGRVLVMQKKDHFKRMIALLEVVLASTGDRLCYSS